MKKFRFYLEWSKKKFVKITSRVFELSIVSKANKPIFARTYSGINKEWSRNFFVNNYVEKLDEIATHYYSPNPSIDSITCEFDDEYLYIEILGNVEVDFQIGSNSDIKRGDGHEFSHSFSLQGTWFQN